MSKVVSFDATNFASDGYKFTVEVNKSLPIPETPTEVVKLPRGWLFPENVHIVADKDDYMYAFGTITSHAWRTKDGEFWELIK